MTHGAASAVAGRSWAGRLTTGLVAALALALALALSSCRGAPPDPVAPSLTQASHPAASSPSPAPPSGVAFWLAVLRTAPAPDGLDAATARLARVLGGAMVVAPANCFAGLPDGVQGYLLGAMASTLADLDPLVEVAGLTPLVIVRTRSSCVD